MANRLADEISPYLLLHKDNPVDWYPWGEEALTRAREEDKPIFLSVGYSTCYWCHVMERESFADPAVAESMNAEFVNIKVDREERPDLDEIYMAATQLLTHQGGWPNSVFLTPKLEPFFAGTYFPPEERYGRPSFRNVVHSMAHAWKERRADVEQQVADLMKVMRGFLEERGAPLETLPAESELESVAASAVDVLRRAFDAEHAGFSLRGPKFPSPSNLHLLFDVADEDDEAASMLEATLDRMARGGLFDQLGGGFHRYATDRAWKVPHFEKMLYDNGLLLELYAREHARTGEPEAARIVRETAAFLERELSAPEGGFWSAIDAETHGHEGAYHVWRKEDLENVLGAEDAGFLAPLLGFDGEPFFEEHFYVLHLPHPLAEQAEQRRTTYEALLEEMAPLRAKLLAARDGRERPATDDKILTDWNGMAIAGLAIAGRLLEEPAMVERAARAADFVLRELRGEDGALLHSWRGGQARIAAFLVDYVHLVRGLLALHTATGEERWLAEAERLTAEQAERLGDPHGGFFNAADQPDLLFRAKEVVDGALPSANGVAVLNLLELAERGEDGERWEELGRRALRALVPFAQAQPEAARMLALASRRAAEVWCEAEESPRNVRLAPVREGADPLREEARSVVDARLEVASEGPDGWRPFRLDIAITQGWHLYAPSEDGDDETVHPTALAIENGELRGVDYPPPTRELDGGVGVYEGSVVVRGELRASEDDTARLALGYQACDAGRCLPPVRVEMGLE